MKKNGTKNLKNTVKIRTDTSDTLHGKQLLSLYLRLNPVNPTLKNIEVALVN